MHQTANPSQANQANSMLGVWVSFVFYGAAEEDVRAGWILEEWFDGCEVDVDGWAKVGREAVSFGGLAVRWWGNYCKGENFLVTWPLTKMDVLFL